MCGGARHFFFAGPNRCDRQIRRDRKNRVVYLENLGNSPAEAPPDSHSRGDAAMKKKWTKPVATQSATPLEVTSYMEAELEDELLSNK